MTTVHIMYTYSIFVQLHVTVYMHIYEATRFSNLHQENDQVSKKPILFISGVFILLGFTLLISLETILLFPKISIFLPNRRVSYYNLSPAPPSFWNFNLATREARCDFKCSSVDSEVCTPSFSVTTLPKELEPNSITVKPTN